MEPVTCRTFICVLILTKHEGLSGYWCSEQLVSDWPGWSRFPSFCWAFVLLYLQLLDVLVGSAKNLVVIHHPVLSPQESHRRVCGVDREQRFGRSRICRKKHQRKSFNQRKTCRTEAGQSPAKPTSSEHWKASRRPEGEVTVRRFCFTEKHKMKTDSSTEQSLKELLEWNLFQS